MLMFSLSVTFIYNLGIFPMPGNPGIEGINDANVLSRITGLTGGMEGVWLLVTTVSGFGFLMLALLTQSMVPIGLYLFGVVFWTAYLNVASILNVGGFIPGDFLLLFTVGLIFIFIAAVIGMLTGSG
jgi:hypothetical protein